MDDQADEVTSFGDSPDTAAAEETDFVPAEFEQASEEYEYTASLFPGEHYTLPPEFGAAVERLEAALGRTVWLLVEADMVDDWWQIDEPLREAFFRERDVMRTCGNGAALVVDSIGGEARSAYQIATLFRRHCGGFAAVVPRMAKSAATLLTLGAEDLYLGQDAELGPLDAQIWDPDREEFASALDEVQALERLNSDTLDLVDQAMFLLMNRTGKKMESVIPHTLHFAAEVMRPLFDKIDTVHYTQRSRVLKVAEDYATRLLRRKYGEGRAQNIARRLVNSYSEHEFVIDRDELTGLLVLAEADKETQGAIDELETLLTDNPLTAVGRIQRTEVNENGG